MDVKLQGFADLDRALQDIEKQATRKAVLRRALKKAAEPMAALAASMAPDDPSTTGFDLRKSIKVGPRLSRSQKKAHRKMFRDDKAAVEMFVGAGPLPQAGFVEFGTSPHINGGKFAGTSHPGTSPRPFMRPAWDQDKGPLLDRLGEEIAADLAKTAARIARKAAQGA